MQEADRDVRSRVRCCVTSPSVRCRYSDVEVADHRTAPRGECWRAEKKTRGKRFSGLLPRAGDSLSPYLFLAVFLAAFFAGFFADFLALFLALFFTVFFTATITPPSHLVELKSCKMISLRRVLVKTFVGAVKKFLRRGVRRA